MHSEFQSNLLPRAFFKPIAGLHVTTNELSRYMYVPKTNVVAPHRPLPPSECRRRCFTSPARTRRSPRSSCSTAPTYSCRPPTYVSQERIKRIMCGNFGGNLYHCTYRVIQQVRDYLVNLGIPPCHADSARFAAELTKHNRAHTATFSSKSTKSQNVSYLADHPVALPIILLPILKI